MLLGLPPEIRVRIYELLLVNPYDDALAPNGPSSNLVLSTDNEEQIVFTSILQACQLICHEALPILYGKNKLAFHDQGYEAPLFSFHLAHLSFTKRVIVYLEPYLYNSTYKMTLLLQYLAGADVHLSELSIYISILRPRKERDSEIEDGRGQPEYLKTLFLLGEHPMLMALTRLTVSVEILHITMLDEARFKPGFARSLVEHGHAAGHRVSVWKGCTSYHCGLAEEGLCKCIVCELRLSSVEYLSNPKHHFRYEDDAVTDVLVRIREAFKECTILDRRLY